MKIISVTNRKGGVGKSTVATHIAAGLATRGLRVCIVDTDSQGHVYRMFGAQSEEDALYNLLVGGKTIEDTVRHIPRGRYAVDDHPAQGELYVLPSGDKTYKIPLELPPEEPFLFLDRLHDIGEHMRLDVIIIDTHPTRSLFDGAIYVATDGFIYVTELEQLSFDGLRSALGQMQRLSASRQRHLGRGSEVLGIVPNKMRVRTRLHRDYLADLAHSFGALVWPFMRLQTVFAEATVMRQPVYTYAPGGNAAADAWKLTDKTMEALAIWQTG